MPTIREPGETPMSQDPDQSPAVFDVGKLTAASPTGPSLAAQGDLMVAKIVAEKPHKFTVSGVTDGKGGVAAFTYDRKWTNGFGLTAYAKAWWHDASVTPERSSGARAGFDGSYTFGDKK